ILAGPEVVDEMARAYEETSGALVHRLVVALEAGQAAGGDRRGQQSAAVVVERAGGRAESREGIDRICDLRGEDHAEPIRDPRRPYVVALSAQNRHRHAGVLSLSLSETTTEGGRTCARFSRCSPSSRYSRSRAPQRLRAIPRSPAVRRATPAAATPAASRSA